MYLGDLSCHLLIHGVRYPEGVTVTKKPSRKVRAILKTSRDEPARIIEPAPSITHTEPKEEETMPESVASTDPIDELVQTIHAKIRETNASEIVGKLIFEKVFASDTDVLNPWQLYTKKGKKTYDKKYSKYEESWNFLVDKLSYMDIDQLRTWYRIQACKELEKELRAKAKEQNIEVVATFEWTEKRIEEALSGGKGKEWISTKIIDWLELKELSQPDKKPKSKPVSPLEKLEKKIVKIENVVNDSFLWKRLFNPKTFEAMSQKKTAEMIETLSKAVATLSGLAKGAENAVMLRDQLAKK